jgi:hypothetical protein
LHCFLAAALANASRLCGQGCPSSTVLAKNIPHLFHKRFIGEFGVFDLGELFEQFPLLFG